MVSIKTSEEKQVQTVTEMKHSEEVSANMASEGSILITFCVCDID